MTNISYWAARKAGESHHQALRAELKNLAMILAVEPTEVECEAVLQRMISLSDLVVEERTSLPAPAIIQDACRLLRSTRSHGGADQAVRSVLALLEGSQVCRRAG